MVQYTPRDYYIMRAEINLPKGLFALRKILFVLPKNVLTRSHF